MAKEFLDYLISIRQQNVPYAVATVIDVIAAAIARSAWLPSTEPLLVRSGALADHIEEVLTYKG